MDTYDRRESSDSERTPSGMVLAAGALVVVVTALVTAPLTDTAVPRVGAMVAAVLLFTATVGDGRAATGVAVIAWAVGNGFLINRRGELRWHGPIDTWFVIGLLAAVAVGMIVAEVRGELRRRRRWQPLHDLLDLAAGDAQAAPLSEEQHGMAPPPSSR